MRPGLLAGAVVLMICALRLSKVSRASPGSIVRAGKQPVQTVSLRAWNRKTATPIGVIALLSVVGGLSCDAFVLIGSNWGPSGIDATQAMNLGIAAGALAAIPATVASGIVLTSRYELVMRWSPLLSSANLLAVAAAHLFGPDDPGGLLLLIVAAFFLGLAVALPFARLLPEGRALRTGAMVMSGLAASAIGVTFVSMLVFVVPLAAAMLFVWSFTRAPAKTRVQALGPIG
jgi:hypothetical protein